MSEDVPLPAYEEMDYDEDEMNRRPPPVWKPDNSFLSSTSVIYARWSPNKSKRSNPSPVGGKSHTQPHSSPSHRKPPTYPHIEISKKPFPPPKPMPTANAYPPPSTKPKPKPISPLKAADSMKNVLADPNLIGKLMEKREELYGDTSQVRPPSVNSWDGADPLENYEEVCFDINSPTSPGSDSSDPSFSREKRMTLPPRRHNEGSLTVMLQCPPKEPRPQDYVSFQPSRSPSPSSEHELAPGPFPPTQGSSLSPSSHRKFNGGAGMPPLPPRGAERMKYDSSFVRRPIKANPSKGLPPKPPKKPTLQKEKSTSQEDLSSAYRKPISPPPRPASTAGHIQEPPVLPRRIPRSSDNPSGAIHSYRELDMPLPLPPGGGGQANKPRLRDPETPPPVPLRQASASRIMGDNERLVVTPPLTDVDPDAPPVPPTRGASKKENSVPSVIPAQRPSHETRPEPKRANYETKPGPTRTNYESQTEPRRRNYETKPEPRRANYETKPEPRRTNYETQTEPRRRNYETKPEPRRTNYETQTEPRRTNYETKPEPKKLNYEARPEPKPRPRPAPRQLATDGAAGEQRTVPHSKPAPPVATRPGSKKPPPPPVTQKPFPIIPVDRQNGRSPPPLPPR